MKRWVAALGLLSLVGATALPVSAAGGKGEVAAEPPRARINADRDGNRLFDNLESLLQGRPPTDEIAVIVQVNQAADDAMRAAAVRKAESLQVKARWDQAIHGFSATVQAGQVRALAGLPFVVSVEPDLPVQAFLGSATSWTGVQLAGADYGVDGDRDGNAGTYTAAQKGTRSGYITYSGTSMATPCGRRRAARL